MSATTLLAAAVLSLIGALLVLRDLRDFRLPNLLTALLLAAGIAFTWLLSPDRLPHHLVGAVVGFAVFDLVARLYRAGRGRDGLGAGDAKLMAAAGAWVGWQGLASVVLVGTLLALAATLVRARLASDGVTAETRIPLGAFLVIGLWATWLFGPIGL